MGLRIQDAGTLRTITKCTIRQAGIDRNIKTIKAMDGDVLRTVAKFADDLTVSAGNTFGSDEGPTSTTNPETATPSGGFSPYTYAWTLQASEGTASVANTPSSATTSFTKTNVPLGTVQTDTWRVTVTDSTGETAFTDIFAAFAHETEDF